MNWLDRLRESLARTRAQLTARLGGIVGAPPAEFFEQLEAALIEGDVGVATTQHILRQLSDRRDARDPAARLAALREILLDVLGAPAPLRLDPPPAAVLMLGVNGAGKTTTIGKLAYHLKTSGRTVLLAAGGVRACQAGSRRRPGRRRLRRRAGGEGPGHGCADR